MNEHCHAGGKGSGPAASTRTYGRSFRHEWTREERLPFSVRIARDEDDLGKAVWMRHSAYARHIPVLAELMKVPEPDDRDPGSVVLLAESRLDGAPLGTMRIQTNRHRPLAVERSVTLPAWLKGRSLAEATRLGIAEGRAGRVVKTMLFKAYYEYCLQAQIEWMVIGARSPLDRQYEALLFRDVFPGGGFLPLRHAGNIPHRVLAFEMETAEARWIEANHPLYDLFCRTRHPDIDVREEEPAYAGAPARTDVYGGWMTAMMSA